MKVILKSPTCIGEKHCLCVYVFFSPFWNGKEYAEHIYSSMGIVQRPSHWTIKKQKNERQLPCKNVIWELWVFEQTKRPTRWVRTVSLFAHATVTDCLTALSAKSEAPLNSRNCVRKVSSAHRNKRLAPLNFLAITPQSIADQRICNKLRSQPPRVTRGKNNKG